MRWLIVVLAACGSAKPVAKPIGPFTLEIRELETASENARDFVAALRVAARSYPKVAVRSGTTKLAIRAACADDETPCFELIAQATGADRVIAGRIDGARARLRLIITATGEVVEWKIEALPTDSVKLEATARDAIDSLFSRAR